jgi:signal transduction histidine kinase
MSSLSKASREIASGNLSYRSNIRSGDEIGALSKDFDAMAQKVEDSVQNLEDAARRQEQFMGSFAHEMKTPMTSIIGYADLLRGQSLTTEEQIDAANYIFSEGKRLENLSFKLLDIFVADHREIILKQVSPAGIVRNLTEHLRPIYEKSGIELSCECEEGTCMLDSDLTRMLLLNLMDNARKALDHGGHIGITSSMLEDGCRLIIADNGKGIPREALQHLTEVFYRVDKSRSRAQGSAGLGLSLCAKIVERHHGTIHFDSKLGTGTTITVDLKGGRI